MYAVGIDIGTTYTAAAVWRDGRTEIVSLGSHSAAVPSVVFLRSDGSFLTGESASRRGRGEPSRVAREFKRRLGETTPTLLGGAPYSAAALTARMLKSVLDTVAAREGGPPAAICLTHPADWGPFTTDRLRQAVRLADIEQPVQFTTEAQAAAGYHARQQRLERGAVVAVYDLGGGTFDAAVLRKTADGFDLIGQPEAVDGLGGLDIDAAIYAHVTASVGDPVQKLDKDDPAVIAAVARLREECVQAKEGLSVDTEVAIPVLLPTVSTEVRLTRSELEAMVRPKVRDSIEALRQTIRSAGYAPETLSSVLLVGGSSQMPIVARMVGSELGRPVAVDANPKHAVALGAAWQASSTLAAADQGAAERTAAVVDLAAAPAAGTVPLPAPAASAGAENPGPGQATSPPTAGSPAGAQTPGPARPTPPPTPGPPAGAQTPSLPPTPAPPTGTETPGPVGTTPPPAPAPSTGAANWADEPTGEIPVLAGPPEKVPGPGISTPAGAAGGGYPGRPPLPKAGVTARVAVGTPAQAGPAAAPPGAPSAQPATTGRRVAVLVAAVVLLLAAGGTAWALTRSDGRDDTASPAASGQRQSKPAAVTSSAASAPAAAGGVPADEQCTDELKKSTRWVCITKATLHDNTFTVWYDAEWNGTRPNIRTGFHLHIYGGDGVNPDESTMGSQAVKHSRYYFEDQQPSVLRTSESDFEAVGDAAKVCARIAQSNHGLTRAYDGSYHTGNCVPIQRY